LRRDCRPVHLERIPLELLLLLAERRGDLVTRDEIVTRIWGREVFLDTESAIATAVRKIRRALRDAPARPKYIATVPAKGYRFIAQVQDGARSGVLSARRMLAVLPLDNLSGDPRQEFFSDGMTEEIIAQLGRTQRTLGVIARTSVMRYKSTRKT